MAVGVGVSLGWVVDFERGRGWTACKLRSVGSPKYFGPRIRAQSSVYVYCVMLQPMLPRWPKTRGKGWVWGILWMSGRIAVDEWTMSLASTRQHCIPLSHSPLTPTLPLSPETPPRDTSWGAPAIRARFASLPMSLSPVRLSSVLGMPHDTRAVTSAPHVAATRVDRWTNIPFPVPSAAKNAREFFCLNLCWNFSQSCSVVGAEGTMSASVEKLAAGEKRRERVGGCCWRGVQAWLADC